LKHDKLKDLIRSAVFSGRYIYSFHSKERMKERRVTRQEVRHVLLHGHHEKRKDLFERSTGQWKYAIRGKTIDKKVLRIILTFDENNLLIITVIEIK